MLKEEEVEPCPATLPSHGVVVALHWVTTERQSTHRQRQDPTLWNVVARRFLKSKLSHSGTTVAGFPLQICAKTFKMLIKHNCISVKWCYVTETKFSPLTLSHSKKNSCGCLGLWFIPTVTTAPAVIKLSTLLQRCLFSIRYLCLRVTSWKPWYTSAIPCRFKSSSVDIFLLYLL